MFIRNLPAGGGSLTPGGGASGFTVGSVIFADATGALNQDNANLFWDDTLNLLGIGTAVPSSPLHVAGTVSPAANSNGFGSRLSGTIVEAGSGNHAFMAGVACLAPTITPGAATVGVAATLYVDAAPTATVTGADSFVAAAAIAPDSDALTIIGRIALGSWVATDEVNIGHFDNRASATGYCFRAGANNSLFNAPNASTGQIFFQIAGSFTVGWTMGQGAATPHFAPMATNVQDIGTAALRVRDGFLSRSFNLTQTVITTGTPSPMLNIIGGANTGLTLSVEATDVFLNLARTVQFATGALATQRAVRIDAPTYAFVGASTITAAATVYISGAPIAGAFATITKAYSFWIDAGLPRIDSTTANGAVATVLGSVGPTGSSTAVQEWLTIDINGTTRFLPCF